MHFKGGMSFWLDTKHRFQPKPGDRVKMWGQQLGFVRGLAINGQVLYYETAEGWKARRDKENQERDQKKKANADARRLEMDARVAALPICFQKRIERFRRNNPDFYWEYED
jgi:hypothetical protein